MKKNYLSLLPLLLCMLLAVGCFSCTDDPANEPEQPVTPEKPEPEPEPLPLPEGYTEAQLRADIAQMMVCSFSGDVLDKNSTIYRDIHQYGIGGVILFEWQNNIQSPEQLKKLCDDLKAANSGLLISIDQEGGTVSRLNPKHGYPSFPAAAVLGNAADSVTTRWAHETASALASAGINLNFAPVVDVNVNPRSPAIGALNRSFSPNPNVVSQKASLWIEQHTDLNVVSCAKHFPGHGSAVTDTHKGFTDVTNTWSDSELIPYRDLIEAEQLDMVMIGHLFNSNLDPLYPASLSKATITTLLREQLKFDGVVITDDLSMGAVADNYDFNTIIECTINAGSDLLCLCHNNGDAQFVPNTINMIYDKVRSGKIDVNRIRQSAARIAALKAKIAQAK